MNTKHSNETQSKSETSSQLAWPELSYEKWVPTKKTLQMCTQMIGKARLALSPPQPEWLHACLYLDGRGFTTGVMPYGENMVSMGIDVYVGFMWIRISDGRHAEVPITSDRCVADIWADFQARLVSLNLKVDIYEKPQELDDTTPFSENAHDCTFAAEDAQRFYGVISAVAGVLEEFRSQFFGRSGVQFWWGAFDTAMLLFNGRKEEAPVDKGYIMRYDLDAAHMNAGFWPGDDKAPEAGFYAYLYPRPDDCETVPIQPEYAGWVETMGEWMMPYEAVRKCKDPRQAILDFLGSVYNVAITQGGWDGKAHEYVKPVPSPLAEAKKRIKNE